MMVFEEFEEEFEFCRTCCTLKGAALNEPLHYASNHSYVRVMFIMQLFRKCHMSCFRLLASVITCNTLCCLLLILFRENMERTAEERCRKAVDIYYVRYKKSARNKLVS